MPPALSTFPHDYLAIQPEVAAALRARRPVVALESTIIAHGMPYPRNVETARAVSRWRQASKQPVRERG